MLRADPHELSHLVHLSKQVSIVNLHITLAFLDKTGQHRDQCGLPSAIMTQQSKDLAIVHLDADAIDSSESTWEALLQVLDPEVFV